jgi:hypothetical protein
MPKAEGVLDVGECPYFSAVPSHGHVLWSCINGFMFAFRHHGLDLDFLVLDSGVVRPALLAPGCVVTDTQSLHGLEAWSSARALLHCHTCSQLRHPAPLTQD